MPSPSLSLVIPVLNEQGNLEQLAAHLRQQAGFTEVIVVDGGSVDDSRNVATIFADHVVQSDSGRAVQMNQGVKAASGDYVLFLHADTRLPEDFANVFEQWSSGQPVWGFFPVILDGSHWLFRIIERGINLRSRITACASGDQAICVNKNYFDSMGGYPRISLMEDVALSNLLAKQSRPAIFSEPVITSSRRWEKRGIIKTICLMWIIRLFYYLGVSPDRLGAWYK